MVYANWNSDTPDTTGLSRTNGSFCQASAPDRAQKDLYEMIRRDRLLENDPNTPFTSVGSSFENRGNAVVPPAQLVLSDIRNRALEFVTSLTTKRLGDLI
jgi:hypothetical protein